MDCCGWGILQNLACTKPYRSLESLRRSLMVEWEKIPQEMSRVSVKKFRERLQAVIKKRREC